MCEVEEAWVFSDFANTLEGIESQNVSIVIARHHSSMELDGDKFLHFVGTLNYFDLAMCIFSCLNKNKLMLIYQSTLTITQYINEPASLKKT